MLLGSRWRRQRLLILCYHGVSLRDEHEWDGALYVSPERFAGRMDQLSQAGCEVLPLGTALDLLKRGTLPPRAVSITFDDGFHDFHARALPVLEARGWPSTVYLTTYYSLYNVPVFNPMLRYLLWRGRNGPLSWAEMGIEERVLDEPTRESVRRRLARYCVDGALRGSEKNHLLGQLAGRLGVDWDGLLRNRVLHLMNPSEVREATSKGAAIELHGHRHCLHQTRERFHAELEENRAAILAMGARPPSMFCYPGGCHLPEFPEWLAEYGIRSATTSDLGLAGPATDLMTLPRFVDTSRISREELRGWLSGFAMCLPRRARYGDRSQLAAAEPDAPARPWPDRPDERLVRQAAAG
ncbi:MAG TPA: hypothetical protein DEH78_02870 [Solibacterales bacterium]|nr:hypothetical protein [Bryobacterales bacterium]